MSRKPTKKPIKATSYLSFESPTDFIKDNKHYFWYKDKERVNSPCTLTMELMSSPAFIDLTPSQRILYSYAKLQYWGATNRPCAKYEEFQNEHAKEYFYLNNNLIINVYKLYKTNATMYKDIKELVNHGFIIPIQTENHRMTIYRYSDEWHNWQPGLIYEGKRKYKDTDHGRVEVFTDFDWIRISYS